MKTGKWMPALLFGIGLSFAQVNAQTKDDSFQAADAQMFGETCNVSVTSSITKDDAMYSPKSSYYYRYSFCPDGSLTITNTYNGYTSMGSWWVDKSGAAKISVSEAADNMFGGFGWLNGDWQVVQHSTDALELERWDYSSDTPSKWTVRFDERMKTY